MRLAGLKEFRDLIYSPESAPTMATLRKRVKLRQIPGGHIDGSHYYVDLDVFDQKTRMHKNLQDKQKALSETPEMAGLV